MAQTALTVIHNEHENYTNEHKDFYAEICITLKQPHVNLILLFYLLRVFMDLYRVILYGIY